MRAETRRGDHRGTRRLLTHLYGGLPCPARCTLAGEAVAVAPSGRLYPCAQMIAEDTDDTLVIGTVDAGLDRKKLTELRALNRCLAPPLGTSAGAPPPGTTAGHLRRGGTSVGATGG